jgi:hypothetical protein
MREDDTGTGFKTNRWLLGTEGLPYKKGETMTKGVKGKVRQVSPRHHLSASQASQI